MLISQTPLVSIIMPTYNCSQHIEKSINSVINQNFKNWELLIINDGSTDSTLKICDKYIKKDSRIRIFSQNNQGVSAARNKGITESLGKYISFLDSDDNYHEKFISSLLEAITQNNGYDIAYCGLNYYSNQKFTHSSIKFHKTENIIKDYLGLLIVQEHIFSICSILINSNFLKQSKITFTIGSKNGEDTSFLVKIFSNAKVNYVPDNLFNYMTGREDSATNRNLSIAIISILESYKDAYNFLLNNYENADREEIIKLARNLINSEFKYWFYYSIIKKNQNLFNELRKYYSEKPIPPWFLLLLIRPILKIIHKL